MDNSGAAKGESSGNENAATKPIEGGAVDNFEAFLQERGDLRTPEVPQPMLKGEKQAVATEQAEMVSSALRSTAPARTVKPTDDTAQDYSDNPELRALTEIPVARDAEELPKPYMDKVVAIIHKDRKNPHQLVTDLDLARWDMMRKAFNRNRGDGK